MLILAAIPATEPRAADPEPYTVTIEHTHDAALNAALTGSSELVSLRTKAPAGPYALLSRARQDAGRFKAALDSFGYYKGTVAITVNGQPIDTPGLGDALAAAPASPPAKIDVHIDTGPQFRITRVELLGQYPADLASALTIHAGQPAIAGQVVAAQSALLTRLRNTGYALAKVDLEPATLVLPDNAMEVAFKVDSGPQVNIGPITFQGLDGVSEDYARRALPLHRGERFDAAEISKARAALARTPIFASVLAVPATSLDANGELPIMIQTTERPWHAVDVGISYSTDLGVGLTAGWHDRNLFGNAEQLNLTGAIQTGGNSDIHPGYRINLQFIKPAFLRDDQQLEANIGAVDQTLIPYAQKALLQSVKVTRQVSDEWQASVGISGEEERITQEGVTRNYVLLGVPLSLHYDSTDNPLNPTHGYRATLLVTPTQSLLGSTATFVSTELSGSGYFDLSGKGRTVLALRALVGDIFGASQFSLPPDQRFYAGGSATVRGYRYQSVGPQFPDGKPAGGTQITAGTIELRQRIGQSFGFSVFTDAAEVSAPGAALSGKYAVGAGAGVEYYTSFGPIRLEGAVPLVKLPNSGNFEIYVGLGQAF